MKLLCLDGNSILNRAFYGIKILTTRDGRYTNAVFGFMNIFLKLLDDLQPDAVAAAFDLRGSTFRHKMYDGYKAGRKGMPPELASQLPELQELLRELGYSVVTAEGFEADDILGTLSAAAEAAGAECCLATGDRDSLQLVSPSTTVLLTTTHFGRGETERIDEAAVASRYGVAPKQLIEVKALMGDSSDNIPGVPGIGEKTALGLIAEFGSLDAVYEHLESSFIKPAVRRKLEGGKEKAYLSRELAEIVRDVPISTDLGSYRRTAGDPNAAARRLVSLEMISTLRRLNLDAPAAEPEAAAAKEPVKIEAKLLESGLPELADALWVGRTPDGGVYTTDGKDVLLLSKDALKNILSDAKIKKYCEDSKWLMKLAYRCGTELRGCVFDAALAAYLIDPASSDYSPERLAGAFSVQPDFCCEAVPGAAVLRPLCKKLQNELERLGLNALYTEIELPLAAVLARMESRGFQVDVEGLREYGALLYEEMQGEQQAVFKLVGRSFNLNSPKQMGEALFDPEKGLGLPGKRTKTGWSTTAETLDNLRGAHPAIDHILRYRSSQKLYSTYIEGLLNAAGPDRRVHTEFRQTEARTGRISSVKPNLQNIPVRTEQGARIRRYFTAGKDRILLDADYSQIELRVLASLSGDEKLIDAFRSDLDIHTRTASEIFRLPVTMITPEFRRRAKAVNFGIVYGIGAFSLSKSTGVTVQEAQKYIDSYLSTYSGVHNWLERTVESAKETGYVTTLFGRRRNIPELASSNRNIQALGKRLAMNTPVQGTAADIIKIAMIRVDERLMREGLDAELILQVHDELIVESSLSCADRAARILQEEMERAADLAVSLAVEVGRGNTWYDAK